MNLATGIKFKSLSSALYIRLGDPVNLFGEFSLILKLVKVMNDIFVDFFEKVNGVASVVCL